MYSDICSCYFRSRYLLVSQSFFHTPTSCCCPWSSISSGNITAPSSCLSSFIHIISLYSFTESSIDLGFIKRLRVPICVWSLLTIRQFLFFLYSFKRSWSSSTENNLLSHHHSIFFSFFYYLLLSCLIYYSIYLIIRTANISCTLSLCRLFI